MLRAAARYLAPASATTRLVSTASKVSRRGRKLLLNKALGSRYSRRQADRVIRKGVVSICGRVAKAHYMVRPGDVVKVNGEVVEWEKEYNAPHVHLKVWKPYGVIVTTDRNSFDSIFDVLEENMHGSALAALNNHTASASTNSDASDSNSGASNSVPPASSINSASSHAHAAATDASADTASHAASTRPQNLFEKLGRRVAPVGRLDVASTGILLLTSDGDLARKLLHGGKHDKEYLVGTEPAASAADVAALAGGIDIDVNIGRAGEKRPKRGRDNGWHTARTRRCDVRRLRHPRTGEVRLRFRLRQGLRRQIRLMCEARHLHVRQLHRTRFAGVDMNGLRGPGDWAPLTAEEVELLYAEVEGGEADEAEEAEEGWEEGDGGGRDVEGGGGGGGAWWAAEEDEDEEGGRQRIT